MVVRGRVTLSQLFALPFAPLKRAHLRVCKNAPSSPGAAAGRKKSQRGGVVVKRFRSLSLGRLHLCITPCLEYPMLPRLCAACGYLGPKRTGRRRTTRARHQSLALTLLSPLLFALSSLSSALSFISWPLRPHHKNPRHPVRCGCRPAARRHHRCIWLCWSACELALGCSGAFGRSVDLQSISPGTA